MVTWLSFIFDHNLRKHRGIEAGAETVFVSQHEPFVAIKYHIINRTLNVAQQQVIARNHCTLKRREELHFYRKE